MRNKKIHYLKTTLYSLIILASTGCNNPNASIGQVLKTNDLDLIAQKRI